MNATAVRRFCTLEEAAERLNITQAQIQRLLARGLLREFRDGPHRLLRTADVGAILEARTRRLERQGQPIEPGASRPRPPRGDHGSPRDPDRDSRTPSQDAALRPSPKKGPRTRRAKSNNNVNPRSDGRMRPQAGSIERPQLSDGRRRSRRHMKAPEGLPQQSLSVREWFWDGLLQDRPIAIALLSAMALLALCGLVAGACWLAETFG
ncbi:MAG: excisionase family DNA-binding protein [Planctomycetes bacterium]|nr:excisionase family DNA-binding protein [Planctomycetota bacterium]